MPMRVKLDVVIRQEGKCKASGDRLGDLKNTHFDHRPALWERKFDTETRDTMPPANDAAFIEAITVKAHDVRTHGPGGEKRITTAGSDSGRRSKITRIVAARESHEAALASKANGDAPEVTSKPGKRHWPKGQKIKSRKFDKRRLPHTRQEITA